MLFKKSQIRGLFIYLKKGVNMNKLVLFIIVLQVISLSVSAQDISSVDNSSELAEKGNFTETVAARIGLAPSSVPNGPYTGTEGTSVSFDGSTQEQKVLQYLLTVRNHLIRMGA